MGLMERVESRAEILSAAGSCDEVTCDNVVLICSGGQWKSSLDLTVSSHALGQKFGEFCQSPPKAVKPLKWPGGVISAPLATPFERSPTSHRHAVPPCLAIGKGIVRRASIGLMRQGFVGGRAADL